jgi:hypothetical protein
MMGKGQKATLFIAASTDYHVEDLTSVLEITLAIISQNVVRNY